MCLYAPNCNPARDDFFDSLHTRIDPSIPTLLASDFNAVFDRSLDLRGSDPARTSRESSSALSHLFQSCCVIDIWRYLYPSSPAFTWTRWDGSLASRIDLFVVPFSWVSTFLSCSVYCCSFSDHRGVLLSTFIPDVTPPCRGYWKFNASILDDPGYIHLVTDAWLAWRNSIPRFPTLGK